MFFSMFYRTFFWFLIISTCKYGENDVNLFVLSYQFCDSSCSSIAYSGKRLISGSITGRLISYSRSQNIRVQNSLSSFSLMGSLSNNDITLSNNDVVTDTNKKADHERSGHGSKLNIKHGNPGNEDMSKNNSSGDDMGHEGDEISLDLPALEVIEFDGILNFRSALPGTGLPIYRWLFKTLIYHNMYLIDVILYPILIYPIFCFS